MERLAHHMKQLAQKRFKFDVMLVASAMLLAIWSGTISLSPALAAVDHDAILLDRLNDVRELLDRRSAHRKMLDGRIERHSYELDQLQTERDATLTALSDYKDRARTFERELDRLMPRLLPRINRLNQFRKNGAHAIADIASMKRNASREQQARSSVLLNRAASIEQMRRSSTAVRLLRRAPSTMTTRHRDVDFQIPLLTSAASRLDLQHSQLQRQRDKAIRQLALLNVDIDRLTAEEHRLARSVIALKLETSDVSYGRSKTLRAARLDRRPKGKTILDHADLRGVALLQTQPTPVARPNASMLASIERASLGTSASIGTPSASVNGKSERTAAGWANDVRGDGAAHVASLSGNDASATFSSRSSSTFEPLLPTTEMIGYSLADAKHEGKRLAADIVAAPRQPVAAPGDGRIVFAGDFRSYGLLLIIEHGSGYHTLLWGFSSLDVGMGDAVQTGQILGILRDEASPKLHVELRRNGLPVSPEVWLAASNSGIKG